MNEPIINGIIEESQEIFGTINYAFVAVVVDQTYSATSLNAQSGTAVAEAIAQSITTALNTEV